MDAGQVRRIDCVGLPVDPGQMTVVEVVDSPDRAPGHVVDEVRRGYTWRGRVLRYAEVRAARERASRPALEDDGEADGGAD
jgi:molecular chaperone GrpE